MKSKRFKLNVLSADVLRQKEMNALMGGDGCTCGCAYSNRGGSSTSDNAYANYERGYQSRNSCNIIELSGEGWQAIGRPKAK